MNRHKPVLLVLVDPILTPSVQPYGLQAIAAALENVGLVSHIMWPHIEADPFASLREQLQRLEPAVVGFSFRNLDTAGFHHSESGDLHFLDVLTAMVEEAHRSESLVVVGGSGFSIAPQEVLKYVGASIGFVGPCETEFAIFCRRVIKEGASPTQAALGLSSAFSREQQAPRPQILPLESPRRTDGPSIEYAKLAGGMVPLRTKSGCSLRCVYCVVPWIERLSLRPWHDICTEMRMIVETGLGDRVFIADGEFNLPSVERAIGLAKAIRKEFGRNVEWRCYLEAGHVTEELVAALADANCIGVSLTVDSFHDEPRKGFAKGTRAEQAVEAVELCQSAGFKNVLANLLFGGPRETVDTACHTAEVADRFLNRGVGINVTVGLRVYPGTPFAKLVTLPQYSQHYHTCESVNWLGVFCSPIPAQELARHVEAILRPGDGTIYNHTQSKAEADVFRGIAVGSGLLHRREFAEAEQHFRSLISQHGLRPELELGLLKAEERISEGLYQSTMFSRSSTRLGKADTFRGHESDPTH